jgi:hypothetical protein
MWALHVSSFFNIQPRTVRPSGEELGGGAGYNGEEFGEGQHRRNRAASNVIPPPHPASDKTQEQTPPHDASAHCDPGWQGAHRLGLVELEALEAAVRLRRHGRPNPPCVRAGSISHPLARADRSPTAAAAAAAATHQNPNLHRRAA